MLPASRAAHLLLPLDRLPDPLPIPTIERPFDATVRPPGSKSLTNRALLLAALADGTSTLRNALVDADDAQVMIEALRKLGAVIEIQGAPSASSGSGPPSPDTDPYPLVRVTGVNGRWRVPPEGVTLDLHNAGTATRFLAAAALLAIYPPPEPFEPPVTIDGDERMRQRPIGELGDALREIGATVEYLSRDGFPPVRLRATQTGLRTDLWFGKTASSQFVSALLLVASWMPYGLTVRFGGGEITSGPYIRMTIDLLKRLGAEVVDDWPSGVHVGSTADPDDRPMREHGRGVAAFNLTIEPDASGASYFLAAGALAPAGSQIRVDTLDVRPGKSLQGDTAFAQVLRTAGCTVTGAVAGTTVAPSRRAPLRPIDAGLADIPDTAMTAAVLACFASGPSTLRGLRTLRVKETDRLAALQTELTKLGVTVDILQDRGDESLRITPPPGGIDTSPNAPPVHFDTYHDHRMAMSLALVGLRRPNVFIRDPACVRKTYPGFWRDLARLYQP